MKTRAEKMIDFDKTAEQPVVTEGDHIRGMSNEELIKWLNCNICDLKGKNCSEIDCNPKLLEILNRPYNPQK